MDPLIDQVKSMVVKHLYLSIQPQEIVENVDFIKAYDMDPAMMVGVFEGIAQRFGFQIEERLRDDPQFRHVRGIAAYVRNHQNFWNAKRLEVISEIERAFRHVKRGNGVSLHEADAIDDYRSEAECKAARELDTENGWQSVPEKDIEKYYWIFPFLDPKGYRYYLPAYMVWSLKNYELGKSVDSGSAVIDSLCMSKSLDQQERYTTYLSLLNQDQCVAIAQFLKFMAGAGFAGNQRALEALDKYWDQFSTK